MFLFEDLIAKLETKRNSMESVAKRLQLDDASNLRSQFDNMRSVAGDAQILLTTILNDRIEFDTLFNLLSGWLEQNEGSLTYAIRRGTLKEKVDQLEVNEAKNSIAPTT